MALPPWLFFNAIAFIVEGSVICLVLAQPLTAIARWNAGPVALGVFGLTVGSIYAVVALAVGMALGKRLREPVALVIGLTGTTLFAALLAGMPTWGWFLAVSLLHSASLGFFWPSFQRTIAAHYPPPALGGALARFNMAWTLGGAAGAWLCGPLIEHSRAAPFCFCAASLAAALAALAFFRPTPVADAIALSGETPHPPAEPSLHRAWLGLWLSFFTVGILIHIFPRLALGGPFNLLPSRISDLHAGRQGAMVVSFIAAGAFTAWHFRRYPLHLCLALLACAFAAIVWAPAGGWFVPAFLAVGLATGFAFSASVYYSLLMPADSGKRVGIHEGLLSMGMALGPVAGGALDALGRGPKFPYAVCLAAIGAVWLAVVARDALALRKAI